MMNCTYDWYYVSLIDVKSIRKIYVRSYAADRLYRASKRMKKQEAIVMRLFMSRVINARQEKKVRQFR